MSDLEEKIRQNPQLVQLQTLAGEEYEEGEFPLMLLLIFGACIIAAVWMGILFLTMGDNYVTIILGNHPQRT